MSLYEVSISNGTPNSVSVSLRNGLAWWVGPSSGLQWKVAVQHGIRLCPRCGLRDIRVSNSNAVLWYTYVDGIGTYRVRVSQDSQEVAINAR